MRLKVLGVLVAAVAAVTVSSVGARADSLDAGADPLQNDGQGFGQVFTWNAPVTVMTSMIIQVYTGTTAPPDGPGSGYYTGGTLSTTALAAAPITQYGSENPLSNTYSGWTTGLGGGGTTAYAFGPGIHSPVNFTAWFTYASYTNTSTFTYPSFLVVDFFAYDGNQMVDATQETFDPTKIGVNGSTGWTYYGESVPQADPPAVPLPTAATMGLSTLAALAGMGLFLRRRRWA